MVPVKEREVKYRRTNSIGCGSYSVAMGTENPFQGAVGAGAGLTGVEHGPGKPNQ